jgi:hypothetical protein
LRNVALDAARSDRVDSARGAVADISDARLRDQTASQAAMTFNDHKMYVQARDLANMITDQQLKDQTFLHMSGVAPQNR